MLISRLNRASRSAAFLTGRRSGRPSTETVEHNHDSRPTPLQPDPPMSQPRDHWSSNAGLVLAATGSATGLGNLWKFPYITWPSGTTDTRAGGQRCSSLRRAAGSGRPAEALRRRWGRAAGSEGVEGPDRGRSHERSTQLKGPGRLLVPLAIGFTSLTAACGGDDPSPRVNAEVDTIAGVVWVRNGTGLWRESEQWRVVEDFRVGSLRVRNPEEELSHSRNTSVTLGPNGQIFVLEYSTDRVVVFDGDGEFVRGFGGAGEGPGEFRGPMAMMWDGKDRLWVTDGLGGRYHAFDSTGAIQKTLQRPVYATRRIQHPLVRGPGGTIVDEAAGDNYKVLFLRWIHWGISRTRWRSSPRWSCRGAFAT